MNNLIKYQKEIDGLRAIAVLSVIIHHADFFIGNSSLLSGGFLGVDIFFVISGYLITLIILNEGQNFSFIKFYERRARRILPTLLIVLILSPIFAYFVLLSTYLKEYADSLIASIFFYANYYFYSTGEIYGAR